MTNYNATDQYLHVLSQVLAKLNRSLVEKKDDDSHTNLAFVAENKRIYSHWFSTPKGKFIAFIDLLNQTFRVQGELALKPISWKGKTVADVEQELMNQLKRLGIANGSVFNPMHYSIPEYDIDKQLTELNDKDIADWAALRSLANDASIALVKSLDLSREPRIWPHHFDTGVYVEPTNKIGLGFGLAMKDELVGESYFYLSGYPLHGKVDYRSVPELPFGKWVITDNWKGAVLPISEIKTKADQQLSKINAFSMAAVDFYFTN